MGTPNVEPRTKERAATSNANLKLFNSDPKNLDCFATVGKTWVYNFDRESKERTVDIRRVYDSTLGG